MTTPTTAGRDPKRGRLRRVTALAGLVALVLAFNGDRVQGAPGSILGIDPLEILNLQVKPNVIIVLDSSGSMQETLGSNGTGSGDTPFSKMGLAKTVLRQVIQENDTKASFLFGRYTQNGNTLATQLMATNGTGGFRFTYGTADPILRTPNNYNVVNRLLTPGNPLVVDATNNRVRFTDGPRTCTVFVPAGTYTAPTGVGGLGPAIQTAMNGATAADCGGTAKANTYGVAFNATAPTYRFQVSRTAGGSTFGLLATPASIDLLPDIGWLGNTGAGTGTRNGFNLVQAWRGNTTVTDAGTTYAVLRANKFYNGHTLGVLSNGTVCSTTTGAGGDGSAANPYFVNIQRLGTGATCPGSTAGAPIKLTFFGGDFGGNSISCNGFAAQVGLPPCDTATLQFTNIEPYLRNELPPNGSGTDCSVLATCPFQGYQERRGGAIVSQPSVTPIPIKADGSTPIHASLRDIRGTAGDPGGSVQRNWDQLWNVLVSPGVGDIKNHSVPRERTLVLFVTDGDDTCAPNTSASGISSNDARALHAAYQAQLLYDPLEGSVAANGTLVPVVAGDQDSQDRAAASSVVTYVVNFGNGASLTRSNWIAWGGSGLQRPCGSGNCFPTLPATGRWAAIPTAAQRAACVTCRDAFAAPDADTLAAVLTGIINQGAQEGLFTAQQSLRANLFEQTTQGPAPDGSCNQNSLLADERNCVIKPIRFESTFTLPGFRGDVNAYENLNGTGVAASIWTAGSAGTQLTQLVKDGMAPAPPAAATCTNSVPLSGVPASTIVTGLCTFDQTGGNGAIGTARIKRRIYTTDRNGVFGASPPVTLAELHAGTSPNRVQLWPSPAVPPAWLDTHFGTAAMTLAQLQTSYKVCGTPTPVPDMETYAEPAPPVCDLARGQLEARQIILAYMAGAEPQLNANGLPRRTTAPVGELLFKPRDWVLAESTLATSAVVTASSIGNSTDELAAYQDEWRYFQHDPAPLPALSDIPKGFGLSGDLAVMSVLYVPANDMLHAFRGGKCLGGCTEQGGAELWGFVPYDLLGVLAARYLNQPPKRDPHDFMIATSVRVAEVLYPGTWSTGGRSSQNGAWRRILFIGRGVAGKHYTALDITAPGSYQTPSLSTAPPIPLWSRGNPDTTNGLSGGPMSHNAADLAAYAKMGESWSLPAVAYVGDNNPQYPTTRTPRPQNVTGLDFVMFVGSGYGATATEGKTFFAIDPLTGDVVHAIDVEPTAVSAGISRTNPALPPNALVSSVAGFAPAQYLTETAGPLSDKTTRLYFGDLHGRMWKVLTAAPATVIPAADLGEDQPVATPVGLIGLPENGQPPKPRFFATSGNDLRASVPFKLWGFLDDGADTDTAYLSATTQRGVNVFPPIAGEFTRVLDPAVVAGVPPFRGTVQPATARGSADPTDPTSAKFGVVIFGATRFNPPGTPEAPPPYPCRSSFDSLVYILAAVSTDIDGDAPFNTGVGDGSYVLKKSSRIVGVSTAAVPGAAGQAAIFVDEGIKKAGVPPTAPPKEGTTPTTGTGGGATSPGAVGGLNVPLFAMSSSVCSN